MNLDEFLRAETSKDLSPLITAIASSSVNVRKALPFSTGMSGGVNPSGETQSQIDVFADELFTTSIISTGRAAEVASEETPEAARSRGNIHVTMDPLDGSSNIITNNLIGSIFGFYSSNLPCSGEHMLGAAFIAYGPMLTLTLSTGGAVHTFAAVEREGKTEFTMTGAEVTIPDKQEVFGFGGQRRDWIGPVESFVASLEERGMKLRYGGAFVGDYNQVLRYGGIFGYPALKKKPKGKLRVLYEAAPMAYITEKAGGSASDGARSILSVTPATLAETTPVYLGTKSLVKELEAAIAGADLRQAAP